MYIYNIHRYIYVIYVIKKTENVCVLQVTTNQPMTSCT